MICGGVAAAQDSTRIIPPSTRVMNERQFERNQNWQDIDTSINRQEIFQPTFAKYIVFQDLGNFGSANRPLLFDVNRDIGFHYAYNPFGLYFFNPKETQYINTKTPFTDLFYAQGTEKLIFLKAKHSQNITPRWNMGVDYQRITSNGFLPRQYTSLYNVQFFTAFQSKSKRYTLLASVTWNKALNEESGGIKSDSLYESLSGNSKVVSPKLSAAQSRTKSRIGYIKQYWSLGSAQYKYQEDDTLYDFKSRSHISYTLMGEQLNYIFENSGSSDSTIIPHQYYDTGTSTYDSAYYGNLENTVALHLFNEKESQQKDSIRRYLGVSITHNMFAVAQNPFIRNYQNVSANIVFENNALKNYTLSYGASGGLTAAGYNAGDFKAAATLRFRFPLFDVSAIGSLQYYRPDYNMLLFKSNAFIWENNFDRIGVTKLGGAIKTRHWRHNITLQFNNILVDNWVYAGTDATPKQDAGSFVVQTFTLSKTVQLWKFFLEHEILLQQSFSDVVRVPQAGGMLRYYFAAIALRKLKFQIGASMFYNTAYDGNGYNPANRLFFNQNNTRIGNYPVIDPFVVAEIKRASFFAKYEHVNQGWINSGYYYTPHYPVSLRSFRFGVRWRFYD